jgi:UDP:flavonoid glycosyltransferase YjiC (YdhE family)
MYKNEPLSVLVAPLDWGLGHTTRCIPIIKELIAQGARVLIAGSAGQKAMLKKEFPLQEYLDIPGYNISYKGGNFLKWRLLLKMPAILKQVKKENSWLDVILRDYTIDAVISDNRFGLHHKRIFSVFITHQLQIQSGLFSGVRAGSWRSALDKWVNRKLLQWNYKFISEFSVCWVPDEDGSLSVAGLLSHPKTPPPVPLKYIGILSRFQPPEKTDVKDYLLILISGPEPQRTIFENIVIAQLAGFTTRTIVLRGLPGSDVPVPFIHDGITIYNHLPSTEMSILISESRYIIARSGYSTVMDLIRLRKTAVLVPTPGQTEQEYLSRYLQKKNWMYCASQKNFSLTDALSAYQKNFMVHPVLPDLSLHDTIEDFLQKLS